MLPLCSLIISGKYLQLKLGQSGDLGQQIASKRAKNWWPREPFLRDLNKIQSSTNKLEQELQSESV